MSLLQLLISECFCEPLSSIQHPRLQTPVPDFSSGHCLEGLSPRPVNHAGKLYRSSFGYEKTYYFSLFFWKEKSFHVWQQLFKTNIWIRHCFAFSQILTLFKNWLQKRFCPSFPFIFKSNYIPRIMKAMCSHFVPLISSTFHLGRSPGKRLMNPFPNCALYFWTWIWAEIMKSFLWKGKWELLEKVCTGHRMWSRKANSSCNGLRGNYVSDTSIWVPATHYLDES